MGINLFEMIDGLKNSATAQNAGEFLKKTTGMNMEKRPMASCPRICYIAPEACADCLPQKRRIEQALCWIDQEEEYYARFELGGPDTPPGGECSCPVCDAPTELNALECEYCGAELSGGERIRVASTRDIPDPTMAAYGLIAEHRRFVERAEREKSSNGLVKGVIGLTSALGHKLNDNEAPMTLSDIENTAYEYGVSVRAYLEGLDNGKYMTAMGKKREEMIGKLAATMEQNRQRTQAANAQVHRARQRAMDIDQQAREKNRAGDRALHETLLKQRSDLARVDAGLQNKDILQSDIRRAGKAMSQHGNARRYGDDLDQAGQDYAKRMEKLHDD